MKRVVSLLPSATEALCVIPGGQALLVGRSHECDFPNSIRSLPVLTASRIHQNTSSFDVDLQVKEVLSTGQSLYTVDEALLEELRPDVILTQDLCQVCSIDLQTVERIAQRMQPRPTIVGMVPMTLDAVLNDILLVGEAVGMQAAASAARAKLQGRVDEVLARVRSLKADTEAPEVAFFEWMSPIFNGGHWTPELIEKAGGRHSLNAPGKYSVETTPEQVVAISPDYLIVCPCGYDIERTRQELGPVLQTAPWFQSLPAVRNGRAVVVDGNQMFNRPGPRLVEALEWLASWLHGRPEWAPRGFPVEPL
eukprot:TRINITY_DN1688_c0_g2_i1.p1 TRINITY_DN1688_c0_g2~~TRINITY_DN1688_c0_g2_i1.p1  ORF type:complete len:308 (-),score=30.79 TRINITY_DN1688_c0_g2_i1:116-1039(-)